MGQREKPYAYEFELYFCLRSVMYETAMNVEFYGKDALTDAREFVRSIYKNSIYAVDVSCTSVFSEDENGTLPRFPFAPFQFFDELYDNEGREV